LALPYPYPFQVSDIEIEELIEVPLSSLLDENVLRRGIIEGAGKDIVRATSIKTTFIWGTTARILKQFLDLVTSLPL